MFHELFVDDGIQHFRFFWERYGSVVLRESGVALLVYLDHLSNFEGVWILIFCDGFVVLSGEVGCKEVCEASEDGWLYSEDIICLVGIQRTQ